MLKIKDIKKIFQGIGIDKGDILVLQSSYKGTGGVENGPEGLIEGLMELVGTNGTLIMPAYNLHSWTEHHYFDIFETPSEVGVVTENFMKREDVKRTRHPIHSLLVWGSLKDELCKIDHKLSFGLDSVFNRLLKFNATYATIGLGIKMPFLPVHYTEAIMKVSSRRRKDFAGIYIDETRQPRMDVYSFYVRTKRGERDPNFKAYEIMCERGKVNMYQYKGVDIFYVKAQDYHKDCMEIIKEFPEMFE